MQVVQRILTAGQHWILGEYWKKAEEYFYVIYFSIAFTYFSLLYNDHWFSERRNCEIVMLVKCYSFILSIVIVNEMHTWKITFCNIKIKVKIRALLPQIPSEFYIVYIILCIDIHHLHLYYGLTIVWLRSISLQNLYLM